MGLMREFFCPLDGKKVKLVDETTSKAMGREFVPVKCVNRDGGHIWMVSEDQQTFMLMRQKMGRE